MIRDRARRLRWEMTITEVILWQNLRRDMLGVRFRRQHPIGLYFADFVAIRPRLVVEADGSSHDGRVKEDFERDRYMAGRGWTVLRFSYHTIATDGKSVLDTIHNTLASRSR